MRAVARLDISAGRRFGCTRCGNCCMEPGLVYMSDPELTRIAEHLGLTRAAFKKKFGVRFEKESEQWFLDAMDGTGCPLLSAERGCTVHPVKPVQCSTFPFWTEMLADDREWEEAKRFCPGLDVPDGQLYTRAQIAAIRAGRLRT